MKNVDILHATEVVETLRLAPGAVAAHEALLQTMKTVCCVYTEDPGNLGEKHELQGSEDLAESIELLLFDPPYNVRRQ